MSDPIYQFGDFRLDASRFELLRDGRTLRLERKPLELLLLLVSSRGRLVARGELAQCLWNKEVFVDTEHGINTAIRKIRATLGDNPDDPRFIQTVTGMGYRFIAPVTIQEPSRLPEADPSPSPLAASTKADATTLAILATPGSHPRLRLWLGAAVAAALATVFLVLTMGWHSSTVSFARGASAPPIRTLAVLPLANFSGSHDQDYLADGMTDELITMLAKESTLRVTSRTSVMRYKNTSQPLPQVARALNVDSILEGSVTRSDQRVHVTLQLIRADTDTHLWAESYDRDLNDITGLPQEAAFAIASRLNAASPTRPSVRYVNPAAHDAYLRGHYLWSVGRNEEAGRAFEQAVTLDSSYALGWSGLSQYYSAGAIEGELDPTVLPKAKDAAQRAVQLDSSLPQAHSMLAAALFFGDWDGIHALQEVTRATDLDPRFAEAMHLHALILSAMGRFDEAVSIQRQGTALDPIVHPAAMAEILLFARRYDEALEDARLRLRDFPQAKDLLWTLAEIYHCKGMDRESAEMFARFYSAGEDGPPNPAVLNAFASSGYPGVLRWILAKLEHPQNSGFVSPAHLAAMEAQLGNRATTLALLDRSLETHDPYLVFLATQPAYDPYRADPHFRTVVQQVGMSSQPPAR